MTLPVFETPRLILKSITEHDAEGLHEAYGDADAMNVHRIEARIEPESLSSRRLAAKLGFTEEGTLRDWLCVAGEFRSAVMYSLLRAEWS